MIKYCSDIHPEKTLYMLARHARAGHNFLGNNEIFAGNRIDSSLSDDGVKELKPVASEILQVGGCEVIVHGNMKRSKETAILLQKQILKKRVGCQLCIKLMKFMRLM